MRHPGSRTRLEVIHGRAAIRAVFDGADAVPMPMGRDGALVWRRTDHLVVRRDPVGGRMLLAARYGTTGRDPFLLLDDLAVSDSMTSGETDEQTCRHMVAALLLRLAALEDLPAALVTHADNVVLARAFQALAGSVADTVLYPIPDSSVIPLRSAAMAHRIARAIGVPAWSGKGPSAPNLMTLDLRATFEDDMLPVLSKLFRQRSAHRPATPMQQRSARAS